MRRLFTISVFCLGMILVVSAQTPDRRGGIVVRGVILDGDTIPFIELKQAEIIGKRIFKSKREEKRYNRLVYNVRKAYPYAKLAGEKYKYYDALLAKETNEKNKSRLMKQAEKDIKKQFEKKLKDLTITQGKILVKLLDRETSHSAFVLVKDLRSTFQAYLYQGIGRLFGYNLKTKYDPQGRDADIENIVHLIEIGEITPLSVD